ncbi:MAG: hypothetical protein ACQESC_02560 [Nanobdellota archaeon]
MAKQTISNNLEFALLGAIVSSARNHLQQDGFITFSQAKSDDRKKEAFKKNLIDEFRTDSLKHIESVEDGLQQEYQNNVEHVCSQLPEKIDSVVDNDFHQPHEIHQYLCSLLK